MAPTLSTVIKKKKKLFLMSLQSSVIQRENACLTIFTLSNIQIQTCSFSSSACKLQFGHGQNGVIEHGRFA